MIVVRRLYIRLKANWLGTLKVKYNVKYKLLFIVTLDAYKTHNKVVQSSRDSN